MFRQLLLSLFTLISIALSAQSINDLALPFITNFDKNDYKAGTQNWCVSQDANHVMWFGNNSKLLWYDGSEWGNVTIPNHSVVRSMLNTHGNQLLVGAFQEFGEVIKLSNGSYFFESWLSKLPKKYHDFANVLKIHELNGEIYFQSKEYIFVFKGEVFQRVYETENGFHFSFLVNNRLYIFEKHVGLKELMPEGLRMSADGQFFASTGVWFLDYFNGNLLAISQEEGMFVFSNGKWMSWDCQVSDFLKKHSFYTGIKSSKNELIIGTVQNGLLMCDNQGKIKKHINKRRGLSNNTVLSMYMDLEQNLWLALDNGISYLKVNSPFSQLINESGLGTGYASFFTDDVLYLGTNQGLYCRRVSSSSMTDYELIEGTQGQVWNLQEFDGTLFCSHNNGLYTVEGNSVQKIEGTEGCWKILVHPTVPNMYVVGTYLGLGTLTYTNDSFEFKRLKNFDESSRIMEFDAYNDLWMSHGYKGVYKICFNDDITKIEKFKYFGKPEGLPSESNNEVFKINDQIAVAAIDKIYIYNRGLGTMVPYTSFNESYPLYTQISKIFNNISNTSYIFSGGRLHRATLKNGSLSGFDSNMFLPIDGSFLPAFENVSFISDDLLVIGVADGFVLYDGAIGTRNSFPIPFNIKQIASKRNSNFSQLSETLNIGDKLIEIPYSDHNLIVKYGIPLYENILNIKTEVRLNGELLTPEMIDNYVVELHALTYGNYTLDFTFHDITGKQKTAEYSLKFKVLPPWYLQWYVMLIWIVLFVAILSTIYFFTNKRIQIIKRKEIIREQRKMVKERIALKRKAQKAEQQMTILKNESLQKQNRHKAEEIANSTMELVEKNKLLLMVKQKLKDIQSENNIDTRNAIIRLMLKSINRDLNNLEKWKIFEDNFDEVHEDFMNRFKEKHPNITAKDIRLCSLLRMNLSSKEIAPLLRISIRSVEISRYRLRKKIELAHDINLTDYIVHF